MTTSTHSHTTPQAKEQEGSTPTTEDKKLLVPDEAEEDSSDSEVGEPPISRPPGEEGDPPISNPPGDEGGHIDANSNSEDDQ